jgi:hypothetical protein
VLGSAAGLLVGCGGQVRSRSAPLLFSFLFFYYVFFFYFTFCF